MTSTRSLDQLAMNEPQKGPNNTDSLICSTAPLQYQLCHTPSAQGLGGGGCVFVKYSIHYKIVDSPSYMPYIENIAIAI